jgi:hypothetical protein
MPPLHRRKSARMPASLFWRPFGVAAVGVHCAGSRKRCQTVDKLPGAKRLPGLRVALTRASLAQGGCWQAARTCRSDVNVEENMATGLYVLDGSVMVAYGLRHIPISCAQYKANGYKPALDKLVAKPPRAEAIPRPAHQNGRLAHS